ncbi:MAG: hypothetical protein KKE51_02925 [Gammaproteobacteria bacterium]|nr:hypothetical protein [Gammaproteobacteria bacterium]MBU1603070.1 hypothetical protein [Gammaproteobacteria bacterium]MBU2433775.1 hypothetical protein [Gammaproteobacteria bacterium]MBU2449945.1 hypothetical protein [Gammaproteobacteria bacterium]
MKNIEIPHGAKVTREERGGLLDFGLEARPDDCYGQPEKMAKIEMSAGCHRPAARPTSRKKEQAPRGACLHFRGAPREDVAGNSPDVRLSTT